MRKSKIMIIIVLSLYLISTSFAMDVIYVDVSGPNDPGTGTVDDPFRRIQDAIDLAIDGETVQIQSGLYTGLGNYNLDLHGKRIIIRSKNPEDPNTIANTIIDPNEAGRAFYFHSGEDANSIVTGLTIRNGSTGGKGGGIFCYYSSPTITNCVISDHFGGLHGGAIFCQNSNPQFKNCIITSNSAVWDGGALECWSGMPKLTNCIIADNHALSGNGGAIDCFSNVNLTLTNCTLINNSAALGGAFHFLASNGILKNSIIWANEAADSPQIALDETSTVLISYSDIENGWMGINNIDTDPCFASFDPNGNPNTWDVHLQSAYGRWDSNSQRWVIDSNTSQCIDAGDPNLKWSDEPWPNGKRINIGAYGGTNQASMNGNMADFNIDEYVSFSDFAEFSKKWSAEEPCIYDLVTDGVVGFSDLRIFAENWLWHRE